MIINNSHDQKRCGGVSQSFLGASAKELGFLALSQFPIEPRFSLRIGNTLGHTKSNIERFRRTYHKGLGRNRSLLGNECCTSNMLKRGEDALVVETLDKWSQNRSHMRVIGSKLVQKLLQFGIICP